MPKTLQCSSDAIYREPAGFAGERYNLIIVGGGIYGIMLALESGRRGLRSLLLERDDFGQHTSNNHLRLIHGGLRYLRTADLRRFRDSTLERSWFLKCLPGLAKPLECLMPLYGDGVYRPAVFQAVVAIDGLLGIDRNIGMSKHQRLGFGRVLSAKQTREVFPGCQKGLKGSVLWQDGLIKNAPRLIIELLRWACRYSAHALNYCQVTGIITAQNVVKGVRALDTIDGSEYEFHAPVVINAAGPWCREFAAAVDCDRHELFPNSVLVWNLRFNRSAVAPCAVSVAARSPGAHRYFLVPSGKGLLIGTGHKEIPVGEHRPPMPSEIDAMIDEVNTAIPGIALEKHELQRVYYGVMPGKSGAHLAEKPAYIDHGRNGGPSGFYSISGVKFTTARMVADRTLKRIFPDIAAVQYGKQFRSSHRINERLDAMCRSDVDAWKKLMDQEAVVNVADLIMRRSDIGESASLTDDVLYRLAALFSSDKSIQGSHVQSVKEALRAGLSS